MSTCCWRDATAWRRARTPRRRQAGLPGTATRQQADRTRGGRVYRDVSYQEAQLLIELDGRAFHDTARARDCDAARDLVVQVRDDTLTVRLTYALVIREGCATMAAIATLLRRRGWTGEMTRCSSCPDEVERR